MADGAPLPGKEKTHLEDQEEDLEVLFLLLGHWLDLVGVGLDPGFDHGTRLVQDGIGIRELPLQ